MKKAPLFVPLAACILYVSGLFAQATTSANHTVTATTYSFTNHQGGLALTLATPNEAGLYRISTYLVSAAKGTSGRELVFPTIRFSDEAGNVFQTAFHDPGDPPVIVLSAPGYSQGVFVAHVPAKTPLVYEVRILNQADGVYSAYVTVERL